MQKKILLIEDEDFIRDLYKRQFEKEGFIIEGYAKGKEGLAAAQQNSYDLLLLDIMLPDTNGIDILKELKSNASTKNLPIVMLTNLGQDSVIKEGFTLGADGYLIKASFTPDQIVTEVSNILSQQASKITQAPTVVNQVQAGPKESQAPQPSQTTQASTPSSALLPTEEKQTTS